eukprot:562672-Amphidinium_carterae.1
MRQKARNFASTAGTSRPTWRDLQQRFDPWDTLVRQALSAICTANRSYKIGSRISDSELSAACFAD